MRKQEIDEIVKYLIENDVKASDIYFGWEKIFDAISYIETNKMGYINY